MFCNKVVILFYIFFNVYYEYIDELNDKNKGLLINLYVCFIFLIFKINR